MIALELLSNYIVCNLDRVTECPSWTLLILPCSCNTFLPLRLSMKKQLWRFSFCLFAFQWTPKRKESGYSFSTFSNWNSRFFKLINSWQLQFHIRKKQTFLTSRSVFFSYHNKSFTLILIRLGFLCDMQVRGWEVKSP